jgi:hypothetical protein
MKTLTWWLWLIVSLLLAVFFIWKLLYSEDKSLFVVGEATYGHYQIEMACETCHGKAFGGREILQNACTQCHAEALEEAHDSHPQSKFTDPREAHRINVIDARYCITCHIEHQQEQTHAMGVTLPDDYCYHCHTDIAEERESHKNLPFDSCASAGCHNYHDNRALYERFLTKHAQQPWLLAAPELAMRNSAHWTALREIAGTNSQQYQYDQPDIHRQWKNSAHANAGVGCAGCHKQSEDAAWIEKPGIAQCEQCHREEANEYVQSKHGMRLASANSLPLSALHVADKNLPMESTAIGRQHGCNSCHVAHKFDAKQAAVESCLQCHKDEHSLAYEASPHAKIWRAEMARGSQPIKGVSCSTCHMPRIETGRVGALLADTSDKPDTQDVMSQGVANDASAVSAAHQELEQMARVRVQHNQNWALRPNEKMIRPVCMQCHSLEFSIDALADPELIRRNFNGQPTKHIPSIDWALQRQ